MNVVPTAAATEVSNIEKSVILAFQVFEKNEVLVEEHPKEFRFEVLFQYSLFNRWSINCYPAAQHKDYFQSNRGSFSGLENKICMTSKMLYCIFGHGRGGKDPENYATRFVFCLLDWASSRRTLDGDIASRRDIMVRYEGNAPLRILRDNWFRFVRENARQLQNDRGFQHFLRDRETREVMEAALGDQQDGG